MILFDSYKNILLIHLTTCRSSIANKSDNNLTSAIVDVPSDAIEHLICDPLPVAQW